MSNDWYDDNGYPTEEALKRIRTFHGTPKELIEFIRDVWWPQGSPGGSLKGGQPFPDGGAGWEWYQATGGWSGNEEIIDTLRATKFWWKFWYSEVRGGGYTFYLPEPSFHQVAYWGDMRFYTDPAAPLVETPAKFVTEIEGIQLENVHPADNCAGRVCVIHNPTDHHMRGWPLHWRNDQQIFERICPHDVGHPDPDQFEFWDEMKKKWRPPISADVIDDPYPPGNPWDGLGVHSCDGCCRPR